MNTWMKYIFYGCVILTFDVPNVINHIFVFHCVDYSRDDSFCADWVRVYGCEAVRGQA